VSEPISEHDGPRFDEELPSGAIDDETVARGSVYARCGGVHRAESGRLRAPPTARRSTTPATLVEQSGLDVEPPDPTVEDDRETLRGSVQRPVRRRLPEVIDGTDGTVEESGRRCRCTSRRTARTCGTT